MPESRKTKELREAAESKVHTSVETLIKAAAERHTVLNLGQNWPETSYSRLLSECEDDSQYKAVQDELKMWIKSAKKEAKMVVAAKLPLTLNSMELAFMKKFPFNEVK